MSVTVSRSASWVGFNNIKRIFIFGASYCSISTEPQKFSQKAHPTADAPLGTPFPGVTYTEEGTPNWVGHLITKYCSAPRFDPDKPGDKQDEAYRKDPLLVYDYAKGGSTVPAIRKQVQNYFLPSVGIKPKWAPWNEKDSLFMTFVGINDCASLAFFPDKDEERVPIAAKIRHLIEHHEELYAAGARNFLFFDLPPIDQSPACNKQRLTPKHDASKETVFRVWNRLLLQGLEEFAKKHPDCTVLLFSTHRVFTDILEDLEAHGLSPGDNHREASSVWKDQLHPSSRVHDALARALAEFLNEVPASEPEPRLESKDENESCCNVS